MTRYYFILFSFFYCQFIFGQNHPTFYVIEPSQENLNHFIKTLSSEEFKGRKTGSPGQKLAATFISEKLKSFGLKPLHGRSDLVQYHALSLRYNEGYNIEVHQKFYLYLNDFVYTQGYADTSIVLSDLLFLGYGISDSLYDDYKEIDVRGRAIMFYEGEPPGFYRNISKNDRSSISSWSGDWKKKLSVIYRERPSIVFIVCKNIESVADSILDETKAIEFYGLSKSPNAIPIVFVSEEMALNFFPEHKEALFHKAKNRIDRNTIPQSFSVSTDAVINIGTNTKELFGENVIGIIEGTEKKNEFVLVSAHYDHLGETDESFYPGADDNASGTAAVIEMARIMADTVANGAKPRRSVMYCLFSGEENGLLGSSYFVDKQTIPLKSIVANINIDMIGRRDSIHERTDSLNYIYIIGADKISDELFTINERSNNEGPQIYLDYKYNYPEEPSRFYYRSDHYHFAKNNIPTIFYFNGLHADYHQLSDSLDKIDFDLLSKRIQLIYLTTWNLTSQKKRLKINRSFIEEY